MITLVVMVYGVSRATATVLIGSIYIAGQVRPENGCLHVSYFCRWPECPAAKDSVTRLEYTLAVRLRYVSVVSHPG